MDEFTIIKRLKLILQNYNMQLDDINQYLVDFYNKIELTFTLQEIQNVNVEANELLSLFLTNGNIQMSINESEPNENLNITFLLDNIINQNTEQILQNNNVNNLPIIINDIQNIIPQNMILIPELNMFNTIINFINQNNQPIENNDDFEEDILITLNKKDIDNLNKTIASIKQPDICTICLQDIDKGETMIKLDCEHYYHNECIVKYLNEFNYKCPICRKSVGETHAHI